MDLEKLVALGEKMGLSGAELRKWVSQKEKEERERAKEEREAKERQLKEEREAQEKQIQAEMAERERQRQHEIELERLRLQQRIETPVQARVESSEREDISFRLNLSKLLVAFDERKDDLDAYLHRFETIAKSQNWPEHQWSTALSTCLSGEALSVYGRLTPTDAASYAKVKAALLKRFRFTVEGFRDKFRTGKPADGETATQYAARLSHYFDRWIELSETAQEYGELRELLIREQFLTSCHPSLSLYLKERRAKSLEDMLELADQFLEAQGGTNLAKVKKDGCEDSKKSAPDEKKHSQENVTRCFLCNRVGHRASNCRTNFTRPSVMKCFKCGQTGHKADACHNEASKAHQAACVYASPKEQAEETNCEFVELKSGRKIPIIGCVITTRPTGLTKGMPTLLGKISGKEVTVLRDTGSSTVVVRKNLVRDSELTGRTSPVCLIDGSIRVLPEAKIEVETPYFSGKVTALCMTTPLFDLIIGNIDGARGPNDPECLGEDPKIEPSLAQEPRRECTAEENPMTDVTRAQAEAEVLEKVKQETPTDTVPDGKTCREGEVATKQPPSLVSEKLTKLVGQTQCRVVPELVKHQQHTSERDDDTSLSNVSTAAETPSTKPSPETARNKKKRKNKKRSSEHRKKGRKRDKRHAG
uniref:Zinc finger protein n=1 Tax=Rhipicephalus zambeziensis TaxID=60191 RepID=A0A224Z474_9ACAR